ncbi:hypothetical protein COW81_00250 [Candidatus Campbellbacteria bacterium CG22_combo_CG10-13_8_21_14_all_36_13]|uniref:TraC-like domain-containing protein n=1 Tax=Candidatus Campbellbacteria bacterium CG22_combo_CG10-13_8_21_14_all_36_13 TaxID=1974529 RepID=A0A2H0E0T8_9BACT|nr:MAG: hypothetical protein COW81_00250 [Candidatus Campbellbacteria bacterium CG22_combo_CG10-13_8_21_14_all_36_13]
MSINAGSTQKFVPIKEIRNGVVVLKDDSICTVLMASSLNLALKSADEQEAILLQFQSFLNSLDFSVQFFIESRNIDIRPYIALMEEKFTEQTNELMKVQTREYIDFIRKFTEDVDVMTKAFFVVVPYSPSIMAKKGGVADMFKKKGTPKNKTGDADSLFEENFSQLNQRALIVEQGLSRTGVQVIRLGAEELIELYYKIFNPGDMEKPISLQN